MLEESRLAYRAHRVRRNVGAPPTPDYLRINPIGKYPSIVDEDGPGGTPITVFETLAIALYLAEKTGRLLPADPSERAAAHIWASVANTGLTPLMGTQYFLQLRASTDVSEVTEWVLSEVQRYLVAMNQRLGEAQYLAGRYLFACRRHDLSGPGDIGAAPRRRFLGIRQYRPVGRGGLATARRDTGIGRRRLSSAAYSPGSGPTFTNRLPMFSPLNRPINARGVFSIPCKMSSRYFILPPCTHSASWRMPAGKSWV